MQLLRSAPAVSVAFVIVVTHAIVASGCVASVDGEVDGAPLPAILSAAWSTNEGEDAITLLLATHFDVCGTTVRRTQAYADAIDALLTESRAPTTDEVDGVMEAADQRTAAGDDYWTLSFSFFIDDLAALAGAELDVANHLLLGSVCHQQGRPDYDDDGLDANNECSFTVDPEIRVGAFAEDGNLELEGDTALVDGEGNDDGQLALRGAAPPCPALQDAREAFADALEALEQARANDPP